MCACLPNIESIHAKNVRLWGMFLIQLNKTRAAQMNIDKTIRGSNLILNLIFKGQSDLLAGSVDCRRMKRP